MQKFIPILLPVLLIISNAQTIEDSVIDKFGTTRPIPHSVKVKTGLDMLLQDSSNPLAGKNLALVTNHSGIDHQENPNYRRLMELPGVNLKVIFSPEHGLFGEASAGEKVNYDRMRQLPQVVSLYGKTRKPTADMLTGIDLVLYDIQDIGARFYTYISTLGLVMEAAAENDIPVWVLDRPNPIGGIAIEGPLLNPVQQSFVGYYPIPIRYGLTVGELAQMIIGEQWITPAPVLKVIPVQNWQPGLWFDDTDLPWVKPSPNIPDLNTALVYPGICLIEGTNVSEGRGTRQPFLQIGAPWIDGTELADAMNQFELPGARFQTVSFTPVAIPGMAANPKYEGVTCHGIAISVTNRNQYNSVACGIYLLSTLKHLYVESFELKERWLTRLWGSRSIVAAINEQIPPDRILADISRQSAAFNQSTSKYRIYPTP